MATYLRNKTGDLYLNTPVLRARKSFREVSNAEAEFETVGAVQETEVPAEPEDKEAVDLEGWE